MSKYPTTPACRYCGRTEWPYCMNSRDMEDMAIQGSYRCFAALSRSGWGEAGERYVRLNRLKNMGDQHGMDETTGDPVILEAARQAWNSGYRAAVGELRSLAEDTTDNELAIVILRLADTLEHLNVE